MSLCYTIKEIMPDNNYDIDVIQQDVMDKFNKIKANEAQGTGEQGTGEQGTGEQGTGEQGTGAQGTGAQGTGEQGTGAQGTGRLEQELDSLFFAQKLEYSLNYKVKELSAILDYYNLPKRKMCKEGMINAILEYENQKENIEIVHTRRRLWKHAKELKEDKYFSKILLFDF